MNKDDYTFYTTEDINEVVVKLSEGSNWLKDDNNILRYNRTPFELKKVLELLSSVDIVNLINDVKTGDKWYIQGFSVFKDVKNTESEAPNIAVDIIKSKIKEIYNSL